MRKISKVQQQHKRVQRFQRGLSRKRRGLASLVALSLLGAGLSGCGHDNPLKSAGIDKLQTGYYHLKRSNRDCIDGIAARSPNSGYKEPKQLHQECQARYPVIAKTFTNAIGKPVRVSDLQVPDFWLDFFKRDRKRQETLTR